MSKIKLMKVNKDSYNIIAKDFSDSRSNPWFEFEVYAKKLFRGAKFLDLGCGNARLAKFLPDFIDYHGVDFSKDLLNQAVINLKDQRKNWKLSLDCMTEFDFPKNSFDRVVLVASYHHVLNKKDRIKLLNKIHKILKPKGEAYISVWNLRTKSNFFNIIKSFFALRPFVLKVPFRNTDRFYHAFSKKELLKEATKSRFKKFAVFFVDHRKKLDSIKGAKNLILKLVKS